MAASFPTNLTTLPGVPADAAHEPQEVPEAKGTGQSDLAHTSFRRLGAWAAASMGAIALVGTYEAGRSALIAAHQDTWGTLSAPTYMPTSGISGEPYISFGRLLQERREVVGQRLETLESLTERGRVLLSAILSASPSGSEDLRAEARAFLKEIDPIVNPQRAVSIEPMEVQSSRFESQHGPVEAMAREVFARATGKSLPGSVVVERGAVAPDREAEAHEASGHVTYAGVCYERDLGALLHELGHCAAQVGETARQESLCGLGGSSLATSAQEEAAAFLFSLVASEHIEDPALRRQVGTLDFYRLEEYLRGVDTAHAHNYAIAIADAAIEVFGSPSAAYAHVATARTLDPRIEEVIERNGLLLQSGPGMEELPGSLVAAQLKLEGLQGDLREALGTEAVASRPAQRP